MYIILYTLYYNNIPVIEIQVYLCRLKLVQNAWFEKILKNFEIRIIQNVGKESCIKKSIKIVENWLKKWMNRLHIN